MRIAPRTTPCVTAWPQPSGQRSRGFEELRELCGAAGDKASLAVAHDGTGGRKRSTGRAREASRLAYEQMAMLESVADPTLTMGRAHGRPVRLVRHG